MWGGTALGDALFVCHLYCLPLRWLGHEISYIPGSPFDLHRLASRLRSMAESARDFDALPQRGACAHSPHTTSQRNPRGCSWRRAATVLTGALGPTTTHTGHEGTLIAADSFPTTQLGRRGPPWAPLYVLPVEAQQGVTTSLRAVLWADIQGTNEAHEGKPWGLSWETSGSNERDQEWGAAGFGSQEHDLE